VLTISDREILVALARHTIVAAVARMSTIPKAPALRVPHASGVFVSIRRGGELRGCLGTVRERVRVPDEVVRCARDAATIDTRFAPVGPGELHDLAVEISVLGPLEPIAPHPDAVAIGVHGLIVEDGDRRGLLLPQVAVEWGWTSEQFLCQTSVKAGLPPDAWRRGARLYRFAAEVFGD
jgi:uncharacterized protein